MDRDAALLVDMVAEGAALVLCVRGRENPTCSSRSPRAEKSRIQRSPLGTKTRAAAVQFSTSRRGGTGEGLTAADEMADKIKPTTNDFVLINHNPNKNKRFSVTPPGPPPAEIWDKIEDFSS